jgi:Zn-dependent protease
MNEKFFDNLGAEVRAQIANEFEVDDVTVPTDGVLLKLRGRFIGESGVAFARLQERLRALNLMAHARREGERVALIIGEALPVARPSKWIINLVLLWLTIGTTVWVGAQYRQSCLGVWGNAGGFNVLRDPWRLLDGLPFAFGVMTILGAHELGHYFLARQYRIAVTLPYFIPVPFGLGTFGAFIRLKAPLDSRKSLFDVGIAGPLAGLVVALPLFMVGLYFSEVRSCGQFAYNNSLLVNILSVIFNGPAAWDRNIVMHPLALAGWVGFLMTAINLLPVGQLDGGHIAYAMFGERWALRLAQLAFVSMALIALLTANQGASWFLWIAMMYFVGLRHPPPLNDVTPLDTRRWALGLVTLLFLLAIIVPAPIRTPFHLF